MLAKIKEKMVESNIDVLLVTNCENEKAAMNLFYATEGFAGSSGCALIGTDFAYFITDFRYQNALDCVSDEFEKVIQDRSEGMFDTLAKIVKEKQLKKIYIDPNIFYHETKTIIEKCDVELESFDKLFNDCRNVKSEKELDNMKEACRITDEAYSYILSVAKAGKTEKELAVLLERKMIDLGADSISFDIIFLSGHRGALPHGRPSEKKLENGDLVTVDFGCYVNKYASDMTRTFAVGEISDKLNEIYNVVYEAQLRGLAAVKAGVSCFDVDKACRDYITEAGYGEYFGHGTGHGLGIDVHESISVSSKSKDILQVGNVVTIEPGIYIEGLGGVRIEDDVVVTESGCEILNKSPKELIKI